MLFAGFCEHLNKLNIKLQGSGKTFDGTFGYLKAFEKKLEVFNDLQNDDRTDLQSSQKLFFNIIESVGEQFFTRFSKFRELEETAKFLRFPDSIKMEELNLQKFSWIDMNKFEM